MARIYERVGQVPANTAYMIATQYVIKGGFVPEKVWVFETEGRDLAALKAAVDIHFKEVLHTELYVKEVPKDSALFEQEAKRLYETAGVICTIGAK